MSTSSKLKLRINDKDRHFYKNRKDFLVRQFGITSEQVIKFFIATLAVIVGVPLIIYRIYRDDIMDLGYYNSDSHAWILCGCVTAILTGIVLFVAGRQVKTHKEALDSTEFLNALFASALGHGHKFCIIVAQADTGIFYLDKEFQKIFPEMIPQKHCTLDMLFSKYGMEDSGQNAVLQAVRDNTASQVKLQIKGGSEKITYDMIISIEPIMRPSGFCLVRGRIDEER